MPNTPVPATVLQARPDIFERQGVIPSKHAPVQGATPGLSSGPDPWHGLSGLDQPTPVGSSGTCGRTAAGFLALTWVLTSYPRCVHAEN